MSQKLARIHIQSLGNVEKLNYVQPTFTALILVHEGSWAAQHSATWVWVALWSCAPQSAVLAASAGELIERFRLHALPDGLHRIRHYGLLANGHRVAKLAQCRLLLAAPTPPPPDPTADYRQRYRCLTGRSLDICPGCGGAMATLGPIPRKAPTWPDTS